MRQIPLTQGQLAIVDDQDYERLSRFKWYALWIKRAFYAVHQISKKPSMTTYMHRLIIYAPRGLEVDHINGDTLDNRRSNLRLATHEKNGHNCKIPGHNTSGFKGVSFHKLEQRWMAYITLRRKRHYLGYFDTPELAAAEYNKAAMMLFGKFARLNQIPGITNVLARC